MDGVHRGHLAVLAAAHAARPTAKLAVLTFEPHPREYFRPEDPPFRLTPLAAKVAALGAAGAELVFALPFDAALVALEAETFFTTVLRDGIGAAHLACGQDFAFGHRRGGNAETLVRLAEAADIGTSLVPPVSDAGGPISSTRIRRALQDGYPERATALLGRPWAIVGPVTHGDKRGRTIGFPTANIALGRHLEPARGVYAVMVTLPDGALVPGVANLGRRPTVNAGPESRLEVHLFDYAGDLYGTELSVALLAYLRGERKFAGLDALQAQIAADASQARQILDLSPATSP
jgi:riboflavin kinase/FMN adenylyltransferase